METKRKVRNEERKRDRERERETIWQHLRDVVAVVSVLEQSLLVCSVW